MTKFLPQQITDWSKFISKLSAWTVGFLALASFVLSYEALWTLALDSQVNSKLAWLWPLTLDFFVLVASLSILKGSLNNEPRKYAWTMVIVFTFLSIVFNAIHKGVPLEVYNIYVRPWLKIVVYTLPPAAFVFSFHLLMAQIKDSLESIVGILGQTEIKEIPELAMAPEPVQENVQVDVQPDRIDYKAGKVEDRRRQIPELYQAGLSEGQIADKLGVSIKTIQRDMAALNSNGVNK